MKAFIAALVVTCACRPTVPARPHELFPMQTPSGIDVEIKPAGTTAWTVRATNGRETPIKLLWDESTFVGADGHSYGRLLRGNTKVIDAAKPQLPTTIVPNAFIDQWCIPEDLGDVAPQKTPDGGMNYSGMDPVRKGVGRMVLVFETASGHETWEGALSFDGSKPPPSKSKSAPQPRPPTEGSGSAAAPTSATP